MRPLEKKKTKAANACKYICIYIYVHLTALLRTKSSIYNIYVAANWCNKPFN